MAQYVKKAKKIVQDAIKKLKGTKVVKKASSARKKTARKGKRK